MEKESYVRPHAKAQFEGPASDRSGRRGFTCCLILLVAALTASILPSSAFAGKPVNDFFGPHGSGNGQFSEGPGGLAVDQETGDVYALDIGNNRVQHFDADGNYLSQFGSSGSGAGQLNVASFPSPQIAFDQSAGSVYVADAGNNRIQKYAADGTFVESIEAATGSPGPEAFSEPRGVAVGVDGKLYVADTGNNRVVVFDSSGAYISEFGIAGGGEGELNTPVRLAVDSSDRVYVLDGNIGFLEARAQRFSSSGVFESSLTTGEQLSSVTVDPTNDHVFISGRSAIYEFDSAGVLQDTHSVEATGDGVFLTLWGLAVKDEGGPIYAANLNGGVDGPSPAVLIFNEPGIATPVVTIDPITVFDSVSATLTGEINPNGNVDAQWRFQVSSDGGGTWNDVGSGGTVPEGTTPEAVSTEATGLEPNVEYQVRLLATKWFLAGQGTDSTSLHTVAAPPAVDALDPGPVTSDSAWLGARVNPLNSATRYFIQYSTSPTFVASQRYPLSGDVPAGAGGSSILAAHLVSDLAAGTDYYYRVVAANAAGTTIGETRAFSTLEGASQEHGLPDGRVWEKVSPAAKGGANIHPGPRSGESPPLSNWAQASVDGNAVTYASAGKFGGEGGPPYSQYLAKRGPGGWVTEGISPPVEPTPGTIFNTNKYVWFSDDLSLGIVEADAALNPGDPAWPIDNLYVRNNNTGTYRTISNGAGMSPASGVRFHFQAASADAGVVAFLRDESGAASVFMRSSDGELKALPGNAGASRNLPDDWDTRVNAVSADGSRVYVNDTPGFANGVQYLIENGGSPIPVSASERSGDLGTLYSGEFMGAARDGSVAYFKSFQPLTEESNDSEGFGNRLYRFNAASPVGHRLTDITVAGSKGIEAFGMTAISEDGASAYFVADGDLVGNGKRVFGLYLWRQGEGVRLVAPGADEEALWSGNLASGNYREARITPDGRYLAFSSTKALTAYDTAGTNQLYLYDSHVDRLTCVSCGLVTQKSKQSSWFLSCISEKEQGNPCLPVRYMTHSLRPDGGRIIFDSKDALVPEDSNGLTDVYQWQGGRLSLLSSGTSGTASRLLDASEDGDDVFFTTSQRLVPSDTDDLADLYDARVGGRFEPSAKSPCVADECQGTPSPPPSFGSPSSNSFDGPGNQRQGTSPMARCTRANSKARRISRQAKQARRSAKRLKAENHSAAARMSRKAKRLSKRAATLSKGSKRCRARVHARASR